MKHNLKLAYNNHAQERDMTEMQEWKEKPRKLFLKLIEEEGKKTLLEIGAGPGRDSKFFKENNLDVTATDLSNEMIKLCREKGIEAYELDFFDIKQIGKKFDAVWAMNCLLHVEKINLGLVLQGIDSVLNPSGLFFMGVYGGENKEGIWENDSYNPKRFFSFYTDENIRKIVEEYFDIESFQKVDTGERYYFQSIIMRKK